MRDEVEAVDTEADRLEDEGTAGWSADLAPEPTPETAAVLAADLVIEDETTDEVMEALLEPEEIAPEEGAMHVVAEDEV